MKGEWDPVTRSSSFFKTAFTAFELEVVLISLVEFAKLGSCLKKDGPSFMSSQRFVKRYPIK